MARDIGTNVGGIVTNARDITKARNIITKARDIS